MRSLSTPPDARSRKRLPAVIAVAGMAALAATTGNVTMEGTPASSAPTADVIVQYGTAAPEATDEAVRRAGGTIGARLNLIGGVAASVPRTAVSGLRSLPGVAAVTEDVAVTLAGKIWRADSDENSMLSITEHTGAKAVWKRKDAAGRPLNGNGIGIALIDSGIAPVKGLGDKGRIINGPDLSFESQAPNLRHLDTFGHGTHMAGIILGRDPVPGENDDESENADPNHFVGMAPGANLINIKVAAADGATDVSQVIAAIDWVVTHRNDPGLNIKVLNLSFGTDSNQDPRFDPLSHAVEAAWRKGIVVVVSAGNDGSRSTRLSMPAANPYVLAVGSVDSKGTAKKDDDVVADFSTRGNGQRRADLLAPGRSVVSLRDPKSYIDVNYPSGRIPTDVSQRFFRGSGTSQSAAVLSGAAALLLQQRPTLTPDQVKKLLVSTATPVKKADLLAAGAGQLDLAAAYAAKTPVTTQIFASALGTGSLEKSRGSVHVADSIDGVELRGEVDVMGRTWSGSTWAPLASAGSAWTGSSWNGSDWAGADWSGSVNWAGRTWSGRTWSGRTWSGRTWSGRTWSNAVWDGATWSGRTWSGRTWSGRTWCGGYWSGDTWR